MKHKSIPKKTKIFINAMSSRRGGGRTYLRNLLADPPDAELHVAAPSSLLEELPSKRNLNKIRHRSAEKNAANRILWEATRLPVLIKRLAPDVFYCPGGYLPRLIKGPELVTAFRNMLPFSPDQTRDFPLTDRLRYLALRIQQSKSFIRADGIIFLSQHARNTIRVALPQITARDIVIPHGISSSFHNQTGGLHTIPHIASDTPYVLYMSTLNYYKRQSEVVRAWAAVPDVSRGKTKLLLVGPKHPKYTKTLLQEIQRTNKRDSIVVTGPVPHDATPALYRNSVFNIFASTCENCPNIMLEAMASGRALLCSDTAPMTEIGRDTVLYFNATNTTSLTNLLTQALDNPRALNDYGKRCATRAKDFLWENTREATWRFLLAGKDKRS